RRLQDRGQRGNRTLLCPFPGRRRLAQGHGLPGRGDPQRLRCDRTGKDRLCAL
ncbi:MAG: hypothetical protein AVDCRST_MAG78-1069, partial [uncultured Rubrobacteraceae bacterium]